MKNLVVIIIILLVLSASISYLYITTNNKLMKASSTIKNLNQTLSELNQKLKGMNQTISQLQSIKANLLLQLSQLNSSLSLDRSKIVGLQTKLKEVNKNLSLLNLELSLIKTTEGVSVNLLVENQTFDVQPKQIVSVLEQLIFQKGYLVFIGYNCPNAGASGKIINGTFEIFVLLHTESNMGSSLMITSLDYPNTTSFDFFLNNTDSSQLSCTFSLFLILK